MSDSTPDFAKGVPADSVADRPLAGTFEGERVVLVRAGGRLCAVAGTCTHLGAPLEKGLIVGDEIRCPWHHARFAIATGEAIGAPAIAPLACYTVCEQDGVVRITERSRVGPVRHPGSSDGRIVIVGGGAAGYACADMLARAGQGGRVTMLSADADPPYDRTFCSKHYLAGEKSRAECMMPTPGQGLGPPPDIRSGVEVVSLDSEGHAVVTAQGGRIGYDRLVLATGAEPIVPRFAGSDHPAVHVLRTLADADALIAAASAAKTVAVLGGSFIGLEVAAAMIARGLAVTVISRDAIPLAAVLGAEVGGFVRSLHERKGVRFRVGRKVGGYDGTSVTLDDGTMVQADMLVVGAGVAPRIGLAKAAGLRLAEGGGVAVDGYLATSAADVYAIGDIASYPSRRLGHAIRVEHWVHAQRQGQHLARLLLGTTAAPFGDTPFFWSTHHDVGIHYVGHATAAVPGRIEGEIAAGEFALFLGEGGGEQALVTLERDVRSLEVEAAWECEG